MLSQHIPTISFPRLRVWLLLVVCTALAAPTTAQITETQRLVGRNDRLQDFFGSATAASDGWLFVGAYNESPPSDPSSPWGGAVYVYRRRVSGWVHTQTLESPSATAGAFGHKLAVSGDVLVVGDPVDSWAASAAGKAHVFELSGGSWVFRQELLSHSPGLAHAFGGPVDVDGDRIIVGETGEDSLGLSTDNGAVTVFERGAMGWRRTAVLFPANRPDQDIDAVGFGRAVLSGNRIASLAWIKKRHIQVFELGPGGWKNTVFLYRPDGMSFDHFGDSLALDGDWLAVGEPAIELVIPARLGKVTMFEFTGAGGSNGWELRQTLTASNGSTSSGFNTDRFGFSVDLQGERLLAGARYGFSGAGYAYGQAYLFELGPNGLWSETERFSTEAAESGQTEGAALGHDVALFDAIVLAGASLDFGRSGTVRSGAAYIYELPLGESECRGVPNSTGVGSSLALTGVARARVNGVDATAEDLPAAALGLLLASQSNGFPIVPPGSQGTLCLGGAIRRLLHTLGPATSAGTWFTPLDLPKAGIVVQAGDTWNFQLWYRDSTPQPTSNFSNSVQVTWH